MRKHNPGQRRASKASVNNDENGTNIQAVSRILSSLPKETPDEIRTLVAQSVSITFSGPVPPPEIMEHYEELYPGATKRMFDMASRQQTIRSDENKANRRNELIRTLCATAVSAILVGGAVFLAVSGHEKIALALVLTGTIPAIVMYFNRKS